MPSKKPKRQTHEAFIPLVVLALIIWFAYRFLFHFPIWFDETIGKALFFGFPVWLYVQISGSESMTNTFSLNKFHSGLLSGIAVGGLFGFAAALLGLAESGGVQAAQVFASDRFWWEFMLALFTGFWETIFFFSWLMVVIQEKWPHWSLAKQVLAVAGLFLVFHMPNTFLRFSGTAVAGQLVLLFAFAVGQALFFANRRNGYALTLSHAIWGMVLLVHLT